MSDPVEHFDAKKSNLTSEDDDEIVESDIELDNTDIVEPDNDPPQKVGLDRVRCESINTCHISILVWSKGP